VTAPKLHIRKDRFHKLFPDIAESDVVIKCKLCCLNLTIGIHLGFGIYFIDEIYVGLNFVKLIFC